MEPCRTDARYVLYWTSKERNPFLRTLLTLFNSHNVRRRHVVLSSLQRQDLCSERVSKRPKVSQLLCKDRNPECRALERICFTLHPGAVHREMKKYAKCPSESSLTIHMCRQKKKNSFPPLLFVSVQCIKERSILKENEALGFNPFEPLTEWSPPS